MAERKRVEQKTTDLVDRQRRPNPVIVVKPTPIIELVSEVKVRTKPSDNKYIKFTLEELKSKGPTISERIKKNEIKFAYYGVDGEKFYWFYQILK